MYMSVSILFSFFTHAGDFNKLITGSIAWEGKCDKIAVVRGVLCIGGGGDSCNITGGGRIDRQLTVDLAEARTRTEAAGEAALGDSIEQSEETIVE
jgi:hypothetical protein